MIWSTSFAPKSNWRMRASRFASSSGLRSSLDASRQSTTPPGGAMVSFSTTLPCRLGSSGNARLKIAQIAPVLRSNTRLMTDRETLPLPSRWTAPRAPPAPLPPPVPPTPTPLAAPGPCLTGASCTAIGAPCRSARSLDIARRPTPAAVGAIHSASGSSFALGGAGIGLAFSSNSFARRGGNSCGCERPGVTRSISSTSMHSSTHSTTHSPSAPCQMSSPA